VSKPKGKLDAASGKMNIRYSLSLYILNDRSKVLT